MCIAIGQYNYSRRVTNSYIDELRYCNFEVNFYVHS